MVRCHTNPLNWVKHMAHRLPLDKGLIPQDNGQCVPRLQKYALDSLGHISKQGNLQASGNLGGFSLSGVPQLSLLTETCPSKIFQGMCKRGKLDRHSWDLQDPILYGNSWGIESGPSNPGSTCPCNWRSWAAS